MLPEKSYFSYFSPPCLLIQLYKLYACMLLDRCRCHRRRYSNTTSGHRYTAFDDCRMMMTLLTQYLHNALVRPHRSTSYRPIACYRRRSVVCRSVGRSVCMSPAKTAKKIEMPFRKWTRTPMDPRNEPCIRWGPDPYSRRANYEGEKRPAQDMPRHVRRSIYSK